MNLKAKLLWPLEKSSLNFRINHLKYYSYKTNYNDNQFNDKSKPKNIYLQYYYLFKMLIFLSFHHSCLSILRPKPERCNKSHLSILRIFLIYFQYLPINVYPFITDKCPGYQAYKQYFRNDKELNYKLLDALSMIDLYYSLIEKRHNMF